MFDDGVMKNKTKSETTDLGGGEEAVFRLLRWLGEDVDRQGLRDTPARVARAYRELCDGYGKNPQEALSVTFDAPESGRRELVVLAGVRFYSLCEHHLAPIVGSATVGYVPDKKIVGLSKLARVVEIFARRLQVQERLTAQIVDAIDETLKPRGAAVHIVAEHFCLSARGAHKPGAKMITSSGTGVLAHNGEMRARFDRIAIAPDPVSIGPGEG